MMQQIHTMNAMTQQMQIARMNQEAIMRQKIEKSRELEKEKEAAWKRAQVETQQRNAEQEEQEKTDAEIEAELSSYIDEDYDRFLEELTDVDGNQSAPQATMEALAEAWNQAEASAKVEEEWGVENRLEEYSYSDSERTQRDATDPMADGIRHFNAGELTQAISCFEEEVRRNVDNAEGWRYLGKCHCEGDEDAKAIVCLEHSVERDPYCLDALLTLGVSYVNEMDLDRALKNLKAWVVNNPTFCGLDIESGVDFTGDKLREVEDILKSALKFSPGDPDVLECLGVLHNVSKNYNDAVECLEKALIARPEGA